MKSKLAMHLSPRCTAMSKRTRERCRAPAVKGWTVCRFHGAGGGGPKGKRNGMYRHGLATREAVAERRAIDALLRASRATLATVPIESAGDEPEARRCGGRRAQRGLGRHRQVPYP